MKAFILLALTVFVSAPSFAHPKLARCTLKVDGHYYLQDKACVFEKLDSQGSFTIGVDDAADRAADHFAYVTIEDGVARGTWNGPDADSNASSELGELKNQHNGCWSNHRAVVCAQ